MIVRTVADQVRMRHALFTESAIADGVIVGVIDAGQRTLLLQLGGAIDGLVSTSVTTAIVIGGALVGQVGGVPVYLTTAADGWPIHLDANNVPYVDFSEAPIAGDPFGENGGTPGFPLPTDFLKLIAATYVDSNNGICRLNVIAEAARLDRSRSLTPTAFVSGNRLVPVRPLASNNSSDPWASGVESVQLSYVALPALTSLADVMVLPSVLMEPLISVCVEACAFMIPTMPALHMRSLSEAARRAEKIVGDYATDVVGNMEDSRVQYRG